MFKEFGLEGKTALVTGGGRGLGKVMSLVMAEAGADVAVVARTTKEVEVTAEAIQKLGRRSLALTADVTDSAQVDEMVSKATRELGRIDILVNNAGLSLGAIPVVPLPEPPEHGITWAIDTGFSDENWNAIVQTNLYSAFYCSRAVAPQMVKRRGGKIINIASVRGLVAESYYAAYDSSKAAMKMLTKALALEWAKYNINVNGIGPGWFITELTQSRFDDPEFYKRSVTEIPLGRLTDSRDLGLLAVYLASPASDWMTGQVIYLDGGQSALHS